MENTKKNSYQIFNVESSHKNERLDIFVNFLMPQLTRSHIKTMIENGLVLLNDKTKKCGEKLRENDKVKIFEEEAKNLDVVAQNIDLDIVYEDSDLAVINKPQGMVVHPANGNYDGTLVNALLFHIKDLSSINGVVRPGIVHRLDKNTSGLIIIAKNDKAHVNLAKQIETKVCHRHYIALCNGNFTCDSGEIKTHIARSEKDRKQMAVCDNTKGKLAITNYNVLERFGKYTLVEFVLQTGRTHQIRVHSKHIGHSIVGDDVYGSKCEFNLAGQLLHAYKIEFFQPSTNKQLVFQTELPPYFEKVLKTLRNKKQNI